MPGEGRFCPVRLQAEEDARLRVGELVIRRGEACEVVSVTDHYPDPLVSIEVRTPAGNIVETEPARVTRAGPRPTTSTPLPTMLASDARHGRDFGATGGKRLGGDAVGAVAGADALATAASIRRRALEAAEQRVRNAPGLSKGKAAELRERQQKEELLGRITEHYARHKLEMPIGLKAASAEQLKKHWGTLRGDTNFY